MEEEKKIELRSEEFQEILTDVPSWIMRWGIYVLGIFLVLLIAGSVIFKYPDTVPATMTLTATVPPVDVVSKMSGKLIELNVKDNEIVEPGRYLAVIENPANTNDMLELKKYLLSAMNYTDSFVISSPKSKNLGDVQFLYSSFSLLVSEYIEFNRLQYFPQKIDATKIRIKQNEGYYNSLKVQKNIVNEKFIITQTQFNRDSLLKEKGVISLETFESSRKQYLQSRLDVEGLQMSIKNTEIQISQMRESLLDIENQYWEKKNAFVSQLRVYMTQLLNEINIWELKYVLTTPIEGKVSFTKFWSENQVVTSGETILNVIPEGEATMIGKAHLPMERSGKVKVGQKVNIRFDNFPDDEFGIVRGRVNSISLIPAKDSMNSNYIVEVELPDGLLTSYKRTLPYMPQVKAHVDIITEDLTVLERFFLPLKNIMKEAF